MTHHLLNQTLTLPNGTVLRNRLAKAAMSETLATYDNRPTPELVQLYRRWASSGLGLILTGNVMIDRRALGEPGNVAIEDERDLPFEFMLNALRLRDGFELARFAERTGLPLSAVQAPLALAEGRGLIERDAAGTLVRPTARGFDFLSDLQSLFLPPAAKDRGQTMTAGAFPAAVRPLVP